MTSKKRISFIMLCFLLCGILGCGTKEKTDKEIIEDLNASEWIQQENVKEAYTVTDLEIVKRNTEEKTDDVYATITYGNSVVQIVQEIELIYNHYSTGGWILDEIIEDEDKKYIPLAEVSDERIYSDVCAAGFFPVKEKYEHISDLENGTDSVIVEVSLDGNVFSEKGTLKAMYKFNGTDWKLEVVTTHEEYNRTWNLTGTWHYVYGAYDLLIYFSEYSRPEALQCNLGYVATSDYSQDIAEVVDFEHVELFLTEVDNANKGFRFQDSRWKWDFWYDKDNFGAVNTLDHTPYFEKISDEYISARDYCDMYMPDYNITSGTDILRVDARTNEEIKESLNGSYISEGCYICGTDEGAPEFVIDVVDFNNKTISGALNWQGPTEDAYMTLLDENTAEVTLSGGKYILTWKEEGVMEVTCQGVDTMQLLGEYWNASLFTNAN